MTADQPSETREERRRRLARERQRRRSERKKAGTRLVWVEVDDLAICEALVAAGELDPMQEEDDNAVREALTAMIDRLLTRESAV